MATMAIAANGGAGIATTDGHAMHTGSVTFGLFPVALRAVDRLRGEIIVRMLVGEIRMATRAGICPMNRGGQFGEVHEHRDFATGRVRAGEGLVAVTLHAGAVLDFLG